MINLISTNNQELASDYTITNLIDNNTIFNNIPQKFNIINKSAFMVGIPLRYNRNNIYGIRITDDVSTWYNRYKNDMIVNFFIVTSYEAYLYLTYEMKSKKPILYLEDAIMTPKIIDVPKTDKYYTFVAPQNLDRRLLEIEDLDIYSRNSYTTKNKIVEYNFNPKGTLIEWKPNSIDEYSKYKTAYIYYNKDGNLEKNKLKSLNRISQCFYFNQEVITNYSGIIHPDILKEMEIIRIDDEFFKIVGNTRKIFDMFFSHEIIKNNLIDFFNIYYKI